LEVSSPNRDLGLWLLHCGWVSVLPSTRQPTKRRLTEGPSRNGCLAYEVGVSDDDPDTVFVVELWESAEAHQASLAVPEVQTAIAAARPLLSGAFGGFRFNVVGSPLRD
jgi:hypothetical protein